MDWMVEIRDVFPPADEGREKARRFCNCAGEC